MNTMSYKGYNARIEYDDEDGIFVGRLAGIRDGVGFHAETVAELKAAFREAVDDYIETCAKVGKTPQKAYSGQLMVRVDPEVHAAAAEAAELQKISLAKWAERVFLGAVLTTEGLTDRAGLETALDRHVERVLGPSVVRANVIRAGGRLQLQEIIPVLTVTSVLKADISADAERAALSRDGVVGMTGDPYRPYSGEVMAHKGRATKPKHRADRHKA